MPAALKATISESPESLPSAVIEENKSDIGIVNDIVIGSIIKNNFMTRIVFAFWFIIKSASENNCWSNRIKVKKINPVKNG